MEIRLFINNSEINKMDKQLTSEIDFEIDLKRDISKTNPIIVINSGNTDISIYNYAYIDYTNRFYHITQLLRNGNLNELHLNVDVLMSFKHQIRNSSALISRTEDANYRKAFIKDDSLTSEVRDFTRHYSFGQGLTSFLYDPVNILICAGGSEEL